MKSQEICPKCGNALLTIKKLNLSLLQTFIALLVAFLMLYLIYEVTIAILSLSGGGTGKGKFLVFAIVGLAIVFNKIHGKFFKLEWFNMSVCTKCKFKDMKKTAE